MYAVSNKQNVMRVSIITTIITLITMIFMSLSISVSANSAMSEAQAHQKLTSSVQSQMAGNYYELEKGGAIEGSKLFTGNGDTDDPYDLDESKFGQLSKKAQQQVVSDIAKYSNEQVGQNGVTDSTVSSWWSQLQQKNGVGSKFMTVILENTKPDFVTANKFWAPFQGPIGTALGILAVGIMICLGFVILADIFYIGIPPFRLFITDQDEKEGGKVPVSKIVSYDARYAVRIAEDENGDNKQALGIYLKRRIIMLIFLGISLLYLVQGQIYTFVGMILDLVSGTLGF